MDFSDSLLHLSFFRRLGELPEHSPRRAATAAALLALREVTRWGEAGRNPLSGGGDRRIALQQLLAEGEQLPGLHASLHDLIGVTVALSEPRGIALPLSQLARVLERAAEWDMASDVYRTLLSLVPAADDASSVTEAWLRLAYCARMSGELADAEQLYSAGRSVAEASGSAADALRARVGLANVELDRGDIPAAEAELHEIIAEAENQKLTSVAAIAYHDRGHVSFRRGDFEDAIRHFYRAHERYEDPSKRDRIMADIGAMLGELGYLSAARDAQMIVYATAIEQVSRWMAAVNLMTLAARVNERSAFEQYREELATSPLPPLVEAHFHYEMGLSLTFLGERAEARSAYERAIEVASACRINEVLIRAESALESDSRHQRVSVRRDVAGGELYEVVSEIERVRASLVAG